MKAGQKKAPAIKPNVPTKPIPPKKLVFVMSELDAKRMDAYLAGVAQASKGGYADFRGAYNNLVALVKRSLNQRLE